MNRPSPTQSPPFRARTRTRTTRAYNTRPNNGGAARQQRRRRTAGARRYINYSRGIFWVGACASTAADAAEPFRVPAPRRRRRRVEPSPPIFNARRYTPPRRSSPAGRRSASFFFPVLFLFFHSLFFSTRTHTHTHTPDVYVAQRRRRRPTVPGRAAPHHNISYP